MLEVPDRDRKRPSAPLRGCFWVLICAVNLSILPRFEVADSRSDDASEVLDIASRDTHRNTINVLSRVPARASEERRRRYAR